MPACRLLSSNAKLNGKLVRAPETGDDTRCDVYIDPANGITRAIFEDDSVSDATVASLLEPEVDESRLIGNPDFPGLLMDTATGELFVPGTSTEPGGRARLARFDEIQAARAEGRGEDRDVSAATTAEEFAEDVRGVMELAGVDEDETHG